MARILRGDVIWADLNPVVGHEQAGQRPVVILSQDIFNERSGTVIAIALTSQEPRAGFPLTMEITTARLPKRSWARISQIRTLSVERLGKKLGRLARNPGEPFSHLRILDQQSHETRLPVIQNGEFSLHSAFSGLRFQQPARWLVHD